MAIITMHEAIRQAMHEEMLADKDTIIIGEDVGVYGGAFKLTDGFLDEFGENRVIDSPIAESALVGAAAGCAIMGIRAIAEIQFMDFIDCAFGMITNFAAKSMYRTGDNVPMVIRGPSGGNVHGGPFHSQNPEMYFVHTPGLKVVVPSTAYDAKGLLKAAIRDPDPVLYFEHKYLYRRQKDEVPETDYTVPIGKGIIRRPGDDITVITYGQLVHVAMEAAAEMMENEEISVEVLDLRSLLPWDKELVLQTARKTGKVIVMTEDTQTGAFSGEVSSYITENAFEYLDGPILRLDHPDTPVPYSPPMEMFLRPNKAKLIEKIKELAAY
jgi:2-oxoisovalerate dehydrogenase E1 component beta subunit